MSWIILCNMDTPDCHPFALASDRLVLIIQKCQTWAIPCSVYRTFVALETGGVLQLVIVVDMVAKRLFCFERGLAIWFFTDYHGGSWFIHCNVLVSKWSMGCVKNAKKQAHKERVWGFGLCRKRLGAAQLRRLNCAAKRGCCTLWWRMALPWKWFCHNL